jgi:4-carboxymuconolactone decarboxylase
MRKLVVLYGPPTDPEHFRNYYTGTHLPLVARLPGLLAMRHSFDVEGVGAPSPFFCIFEAEFADAPALGAAMASREGQAVTADVANYATGGVTILHGEPEEGFRAAPAIQSGPTPALGKDQRTGAEVFAAGLDVRRAMFGPAGADAQIEAATDFLAPMQDLVTRYCFGDVWTRPGLERKTRSLLTLSMLVVLGRPNQLKVHVRGALANGASEEEIRETLLHAMIYAGVPASVDAFLNAAEVMREVQASANEG